jgi:hypothetical protein
MSASAPPHEREPGPGFRTDASLAGNAAPPAASSQRPGSSLGSRLRASAWRRHATPLHLVLALIALVALALPLAVVRYAPAPPPRPPRGLAKRPPPRVVPPAELPPVEPVEYQALTPDDARAWNAAVPFAPGPNPAARAFVLRHDAANAARATDCLAAAVVYEAGDDPPGQRAVAQVVLNRLRHPAFPKTVCGVVFQGQERATGCQFTFTCDGALRRYTPTPEAWARARTVAAAALAGAVYRRVGYATHYHTDWVVPYWSASLDKIAAVHTHLFFRWTGWWGTPPAFNRQVQPVEPVIAQLAALSPAHAPVDPLTGLPAGVAVADAAAADGGGPAPTAGDPDSFLLTLDTKLAADALPALAQRACGARARCKVMAWSDRAATPAALPLEPAQVAAMAFSYLRDRDAGVDKALWNCERFRRADPRECMKAQVLARPAPPIVTLPAPAPTAYTLPGAPVDLSGVRRKPAPGPTPSPGRTPAP